MSPSGHGLRSESEGESLKRARSRERGKRENKYEIILTIMKKLILIDSHALIHRAYHALPPLTTKSGELVNAVYGFTSILIKTISNFKPDYIVAAFDAPGATFRHKEYKEYKLGKQGEVMLMDEPVTRFNVSNANKFDLSVNKNNENKNKKRWW